MFKYNTHIYFLSILALNPGMLHRTTPRITNEVHERVRHQLLRPDQGMQRMEVLPSHSAPPPASTGASLTASMVVVSSINVNS
jgi:hypothetical protein